MYPRNTDKVLTSDERARLALHRVREVHPHARLSGVDGPTYRFRIVVPMNGLAYPKQLSGEHEQSNDAWLDAERRLAACQTN